MQRSRRILAITLVATALCADRAMASAPSLRPHVAAVAGTIVSRLSVSLRRVVPSTKVYQPRREELAATVSSYVPPSLIGSVALQLSPLILRLPPPQR